MALGVIRSNNDDKMKLMQSLNFPKAVNGLRHAAQQFHHKDLLGGQGGGGGGERVGPGAAP